MSIASRNFDVAKTDSNLKASWGELYVGCAGGGESLTTLPLDREATTTKDSSAKIVKIRVDGLLGGNIHEGQGNAVSLCAAATQAC
jgi:hypothetical protein